MKITVGKFDMWPGTTLNDVPVASLPRRIQIASLNGDETILVSGFDESSNNLVSIDYDETDADARSEAIRIANNVVGCHVSVAPANVDGR